MDRRTFLKSIGGLVLLGAGGLLASSDSTRISPGGSPDVSAAVGPLLRDDITLRTTANGSAAYCGRLHVFDVDAQGSQFLSYADGAHTIDEIAARTGQKSKAAEVAMFFVTLGQAGYLRNRVEVSLVEYAA